MTIERKVLRQNGTIRIVWLIKKDDGSIIKISKKPLDK